MRPTIALDAATLRENARAWQAYAGVPLRAVVKCDGYGWGFESMVRCLDDLVDAFVLADTQEFDVVRKLTKRPIITLGDVPAAQVGRLLDEGAIPNLASIAGIEAAVAWARARARGARIRIGLRPAVGWAGFDLDALIALGPRLACPELEIELWTHLTHLTLLGAQRAAFARAQAALRELGVRVAATDVESTFPLSTGEAVQGSFVRLGAGLFGVRYGGGPPGVRCALRLEAPVVQCLESRGQPVGYGAARAPASGYLVVVRCGYGDGLVRATGTVADIVMVGMQYTILWRARRYDLDRIVLLDAGGNIDEVALAAGVGPHEVIVALGNAAWRGA